MYARCRTLQTLITNHKLNMLYVQQFCGFDSFYGGKNVPFHTGIIGSADNSEKDYVIIQCKVFNH